MKQKQQIRIKALSEREMTERELRMTEAILFERKKSGTNAGMFMQVSGRLNHILKFSDL